MPHNHEAVAALPVTVTAANKTLLRNLIEKRLAYVVDDAANAADLIAVDPSTGTTVLVIICLGRNYLFDPLDSTTAHDGVTCLVTSDSKRYKLAAGSEVLVYSVLDRINTPPSDSPAGLLGDAYLITAGATGAWAGHDNQVTVYTARGWEFITPAIGRLVYVEDEDAYYRKKPDGSISNGFGINALTASSILPSQLLGGGGRENWIVENQTTNTPPAVSNGTAYIIGPSPTGSWSGNAGKIAHGENGSWVIYTPGEGWRAWDKSLDEYYEYTGTAWRTSGGKMVMQRSVYPSAGSFTFNKNSRCVFVDVTVIGGSGGADVNGTAGAGGTSSFGAHCSATGSTAGNASGTSSAGTGSGGDQNATGSPALLRSVNLDVSGVNQPVLFAQRGFQSSKFGVKWGANHISGVNPLNTNASAGPGMAIKRILTSALGSGETVTVGAAGGAGSGVAGVVGLVVVDEFILV